jgi:taurine dioxygenase
MMFSAEIYRRVADEFRGARHPIVRIHPVTGRPALYLCGAFVRGIAGLEPHESDALYGFLRTRLHDPNLQCRWRWQAYDVAVWDERCTNHRALSDHYPNRRVVRRCTVGAGVPVGRSRAPAQVSG